MAAILHCMEVIFKIKPILTKVIVFKLSLKTITFAKTVLNKYILSNYFTGTYINIEGF